MKKELEEITCEKCGCHLCWADAIDLNGDYLYCDNCAVEVKEEE